MLSYGHQVWGTLCPRLLPSSRPHDRTPVPAKAEPITRALTGAAFANAAADGGGSQAQQNQMELEQLMERISAFPQLSSDRLETPGSGRR